MSESDWDEADEMCPNCITPWKCNGPHVLGPDTPPDDPHEPGEDWPDV